MVASAIFIMDLKGKVIISRNYRGDVPLNVAERFSLYVQEKDEVEMRPVFSIDGLTFVYIKVSLRKDYAVATAVDTCRVRRWIATCNTTVYCALLCCAFLLFCFANNYILDLLSSLSISRACLIFLFLFFHLLHLQCNNIILMSVTKRNSNITLLLFFLYRLTNVRDRQR
jgi:hypothetical protein